MEQVGKGTVTPDELMNRLAQARKVMNKVESGSVKPRQMNERESRYDDNDDFMDNVQIYDQTSQLTESMNVSQPYNVDKIKNSRLPDVIKTAMIERPIIQPDISLSDGIDMKIIKGAKRIMEQENPSSRKKPVQEQTRQPQTLSSDLINSLIPIIENTVRKVMDEKLNQILSAQQTQTINENLVLKVGDSVFKGKITGVNKAK